MNDMLSEIQRPAEKTAYAEPPLLGPKGFENVLTLFLSSNLKAFGDE
jgi:hypothetical protein